VLDTRQYRSDQVTTDAQRKDPARTITGAAQETWLRDGLAAAQARGVTWKVLAQQTFFAQRDLDTSSSGRSYLMDAWDGYTASRDRILNHVRLSNPRIQNPVVLSGDVHNNWACDLKADFNNPYSQTLGVEFVGTSVTSGGDGADTGTSQEAIVKHNPHIKFFNGQRGYVRCTLTPTEWLADYRVLPYVKQPGATISTRATFTVAAGRPGLQLVTQQAPVGVRSSEAAIESDRERGRAQRQR
jgi:alkaline phosphatase D